MENERLNLPSASRFEILALCPASESLRRSLPDDVVNPPSDEFAQRGTRIHTARETRNPLPLDDEDATIYQTGLKSEAAILEQWQADFGIESYIEGPGELRLWMHDEQTLKPVTSGKLDVHYVSQNPTVYVLVVDWKSLWNSNLTPAERNYQGRVQAVTVAAEYDAIHVRFALNKAMFGTVDACDYDQAGLWRAEFSIRQALWEAAQPGAQFRPGEWCVHCPCKAYCHFALRNTDSALTVFNPSSDIAELSGKASKKMMRELVAAAPVEVVRKVFGKRSQINHVMEAVKERLTALPPEEKYRLGLKMNLGRSSDSVRDVRGAFNAMVAGGFPEEEIWRCLKMSKANVVDLVKRFNNCRDSEADAFYEVQLDEFIERKRSEDVLGDA